MENKKLSSLNFEVGNKYRLTFESNKNIKDAYSIANEFYVSYFEKGVCLEKQKFNNENDALLFYNEKKIEIESHYFKCK